MARAFRIKEHDNIVFTNIRCLDFPEIQPWLSKLNPAAHCLKCYGSNITGRHYLPPRQYNDIVHDTSQLCEREDWSSFTDIQIHEIPRQDVICAVEIALDEADPAVPILCLFQQLDDFNEIGYTETIIVTNDNDMRMSTNFSNLPYINVRWIKEHMPSVKRIEIYCKQGDYTSSYPKRWKDLPFTVHICTNKELKTLTLAQSIPTEPTFTFVQEPNSYELRMEERVPSSPMPENSELEEVD